jgi:signal peptidase I
MLRFLINYLQNRFNRKKPLYQKAIDELKRHEQHLDAAKMERAVEALNQKLTHLSQNWANGSINFFTAFRQAWGAWNNLAELDESLKPFWRQSIESVTFLFVTIFVLRHLIFGLYSVPTGSAEPNILVGDRILGLKYPYLLGKVQRGDLAIFDRPDFVYDQKNFINHLWQKYVGFPIPLLGLSAGPESWVKRVIGLPGDVVEGKINAEGKTEVYLNGELLEEPYINPYPLITVRRSCGFFAPEIGMPWFLNWKQKTVNYTYDPSKSYADQPFFKIDQDEIVYNQFTGKPIITLPRTPSYSDKFPARKIPEGKLWVMGDNRKNSDDARKWGFLDASLVTGRASRILFSIDSEEIFWLFDLIKNPISFFTKKLRWGRFLRSLHPFKEIPKS